MKALFLSCMLGLVFASNALAAGVNLDELMKSLNKKTIYMETESISLKDGSTVKEAFVVKAYNSFWMGFAPCSGENALILEGIRARDKNPESSKFVGFEAKKNCVTLTSTGTSVKLVGNFRTDSGLNMRVDSDIDLVLNNVEKLLSKEGQVTGTITFKRRNDSALEPVGSSTIISAEIIEE